MIRNFRDFIDSIIVESLHPELQDIINTPSINRKSKHKLLTNKIRELSDNGKKTGIEGNMPRGSSRAYLQHEEPHEVTVDGKPTQLKMGTKIAIGASLDKFHRKSDYEGRSLGEMQNYAEAGEAMTNSSYRILRKDSLNPNEYKTNKDMGIFPPLFDHDDKTYKWLHVGHASNINEKTFKDLTKTNEFPDGISHGDFHTVLMRSHYRNNGKYHQRRPEHEANLDALEEHPLVQKFLNYHNHSGNSPNDYQQIGNMGVWQHPDGSKHIVARDHGYDNDVESAYKAARKNHVDAEDKRRY